MRKAEIAAGPYKAGE